MLGKGVIFFGMNDNTSFLGREMITKGIQSYFVKKLDGKYFSLLTNNEAERT